MVFGDHCEYCSADAFLTCSRCQAGYCSPDCQINDWGKHRFHCREIPTLTVRALNKSIVSEGSIVSVKTEKVPTKVVNPPKPLKVAKAKSVVDSNYDDIDIDKVSQILDGPTETEMLAWKEGINVKQLPKEGIEVVVHFYDKKKKETWVVLLKDRDNFKKMMTNLSKSIEKLESIREGSIKIGKLIVVQYKEKLFVRGEVKKVEGNTVTTFLIDYGDTITVDFAKLREAPKKFELNPAFAFCVKFNDDADRVQLSKLMIDIVGMTPEGTPIVQNSAMPYVGIVKTLKNENVTSFEADLSQILGKFWYIVRCAPQKGIPRIGQEEFAAMHKLEIASKLVPEMMIVYHNPEDDKKYRAIVMEADYLSNYAVVFLCDFGIIREIKIPAEVRKLPYDLQSIPIEAHFVKIEKITNDDDVFFQKFTELGKFFTYEFCPTDDGAKFVNAKISLKGEGMAMAKVFVTPPSLRSYNVPFWSVCAKSMTCIKLMKTFVDKDVKVVIHPEDSFGLAAKVIEKVIETAKPLKDVPEEKQIVLFKLLSGQSVRAIVTKVLGKGLVRIQDMDSGNSFDAKYLDLMEAPEIVKNFPVYKMQIILEDLNEVPVEDLGLVKEFFELSHLKKRALVLKYDIGHPLFGAKLLLSFKGDTLANKLNEYITTKKKEMTEVLEKEKQLREAAEKAEAAKLAEAKALEEKAAEAAKLAEKAKKAAALKALQEQETAAAETPKIGTTFDDMKYTPLQVGTDVNLIILDIFPEKCNVAVMKQTAENVKFIDEIVVLVENYVTNIHADAKKPFTPSIGSMCLGLYDEDGAWYRACCIETPKLGQFKLKLIDFGTVTTVTADKILEFPIQLMEPNPRTFVATIEGMTKEEVAKMEPYSVKKFHVHSCDRGYATVTPSK